MPKGGKQPGAGRPVGTGKWGEPTRSYRLPQWLWEQIVALLPELKKHRDLHKVAKRQTKEKK
jgi:DNA polymerase V